MMDHADRTRRHTPEKDAGHGDAKAGRGDAKAGHTHARKDIRICRIGETASVTRVFTQEDIRIFADLTLDDNGMHTDPDLSRRGLFRRPVVHGVLVGSLISSVMGTKLPGHGTVLQEQQVQYLAPVYPGETITAQVRLVSAREQERYYIASLEGTCVNQDGVVCVRADCRQLMLKRFFRIEGETDPAGPDTSDLRD